MTLSGRFLSGQQCASPSLNQGEKLARHDVRFVLGPFLGAQLPLIAFASQHRHAPGCRFAGANADKISGCIRAEIAEDWFYDSVQHG